MRWADTGQTKYIRFTLLMNRPDTFKELYVSLKWEWQGTSPFEMEQEYALSTIMIFILNNDELFLP